MQILSHGTELLTHNFHNTWYQVKCFLWYLIYFQVHQMSNQNQRHNGTSKPRFSSNIIFIDLEMAAINAARTVFFRVKTLKDAVG